MNEAKMLHLALIDPDMPRVRLDLTLSKDIPAMPGQASLSGKGDIAPHCLVVDTNGRFDVVSYLYKDRVGDLENVRHFTNGDVPRPETEFVAWALLPDLTT